MPTTMMTAVDLCHGLERRQVGNSLKPGTWSRLQVTSRISVIADASANM